MKSKSRGSLVALAGLLVQLAMSPAPVARSEPPATHLEPAGEDLVASEIAAIRFTDEDLARLRSLQPGFQQVNEVYRLLGGHRWEAALETAHQLVEREPLFGPAIDAYADAARAATRVLGPGILEGVEAYFEAKAGADHGPAGAFAWYGLSIVREAQHDWEGQLEAGKRAIEQGIEYWQCYKVVAEDFSRVGRVEEGRAYLRNLVRTGSSRERIGWAWLGLGLIQADPHTGRSESREAAGHAEGLLRPGRGWENIQHLLGNLAWAVGEPGRSVTHHRQALAAYHLAGNLRAEGRALGNLGLAYGELGEPRKAMRLLNRALALHRELGNRTSEGIALANLADQYGALGDYRTAIQLSEVALAINREVGSQSVECNVLISIGHFLIEMGELEQGRASSRMGLDLARALYRRKSEGLALRNLALAARAEGQLEESRRLFDEALAVLRDAGDQKGETEVLLQLGELLLEHGDLERGMELLLEAQRKNEQIGDRRTAALALHRIGVGYGRLGDERRALEALEGALRLEQALGIRSAELETRLETGRLLARRGDREGALKQVEFAIDVLVKVQEELPDPRWRAAHFARSASVYALEVHLLSAGPDAAGAGETSPRVLEETFAAGELARARSFHQQWLLANLDLTREAPAEAVSGVESARRRLEQAQAALLSPSLSPDQLELLKSSLERQLQTERDWYGRVGGTPRAEMLELETAREQLKTGEIDAALRQRLLERLYREREEELAQAQRQLAAVSPIYRQTAEPPRLSTAQVRAVLDRDEVILAFLLGQEESFAWVISAAEARLLHLPPEAEIRKMVVPFLEMLRSPLTPPSSIHEAGARIYQQLLGPAGGSIRAGTKLVIVPDGILGALPFEALSEPRAVGDGSGERRGGAGTAGRHLEPSSYLTLSHTILYAPSVTAWALGEAEGATRHLSRPLLGIGDPIYHRDDCGRGTQLLAGRAPMSRAAVLDETWSRLCSSHEELRHVRRHRPLSRRWEDVYLLREEATETGFRKLDLERFGTLHFAVHGIADIDRPLRSAVVLGQNRDLGGGTVVTHPFSDPADGYLELQEIIELRLKAELVVLSACDTAAGRFRRGEGVESLARGFLLAGARNVVATTWAVADSASARFVKRFYKALERQAIAEALRSARIAFIVGEEDDAGAGGDDEGAFGRSFAHPYFWAPFVLLSGSLGSLGEAPASSSPVP